MKTFFKGIFTYFMGLTSSYLANIQPNSKFHLPPTKFSGAAPEQHQNEITKQFDNH